MICEKYFSKFFESIKPRRKNKQPNPKSDCLPTKIQHHTAPEIHKVNFTWTIDELEFQITKKEFLKSCKFSAITNDECKWRLLCLPYNEVYRPNSDDLVSITLCLLFIPARADAKAIVKSDICFLNSQQKEILRTTMPIHQHDPDFAYWEYITVKRKHILPGNKLTIRFNLTYTNIESSDSNENNTPTSTATVSAPPLQLQIPKSEHLEKFAKLYRKDEFKDVLISVNGKNYLADKVTLAAYSPVFASIIKAKKKKGKITHVKIPNVSAEVFGEMLTFINTGKSPFDNATDLYILATEFGVEKLMVETIKFLCKKYQWYEQN